MMSILIYGSGKYWRLSQPIKPANGSAATESGAIIPAYHKYLNTLLKYDLLGQYHRNIHLVGWIHKAGLPSLTIMAITGNKTETSFLKYIKVTPREHAEKLRDFWIKNREHLKVV